MNWTEGTLSRHSRRKGWNADAARQKAYFAKARARLIEGPGRTSGMPSFVPSYIPQPQDINTEPLGTLPVRQHTSTRRRLVHLSSEASSSPHDDQRRTFKTPAEFQHGDLDASGHPFTVNLEAKRRKLLQKSDWSGIDLQKPPAIDFSGFSWSSELGVAAAITEKPSNDYLRAAHYDRGSAGGYWKKSAAIRDDVVIEVGSQNYRWSRQSNSIRSPVSTRGRHIKQKQGPSGLQPSSRGHTPSTSATDSPHPLSSISDGSSSVQARADTIDVSLAVRAKARTGSQIVLSSQSGSAPRSLVSEPQPMLISSSSSIMQHPAPQRKIHLLHRSWSPDSERTDSTLVQVDAVEEGGPTAEGIRWLTWLADDEESGRNRVELQSVAPEACLPSWTMQPDTCRVTGSFRGEDSLVTQGANIVSQPIRSEDAGTRLGEENEQSASPGAYPGKTVMSTVPQSLSLYELKDVQPTDTSATIGGEVVPHDTNYTHEPIVRQISDVEQESREDRHSAPQPDDQDGDEIWKRFVHDDDDASDIDRRALEEAREQTKREIWQERILTSDIVEAAWTNRSESSASSGELGQPCDGGQPQTPITTTTGAAGHSGGSLSVQPSTPSPRPARADFKFHQPQLFVGRLASRAAPSSTWTATTDHCRSKGRGRKRPRDSGRPDFRSMPDFAGDPIEESP